jgi:RHS repeat-associated protein
VDHEPAPTVETPEDPVVPVEMDTVCMEVQWPAAYLWMNGRTRQDNPAGAPSWMGSLIAGRRDATGHVYLRNRYYDPLTGRFTQEDPIGLAGGVNLYGFANGDPVGYSDPYGLSADANCCLGVAYDGINPQRIQENAEWNEQLTNGDRVVLGVVGVAAAAGPVVFSRLAAAGGRLAPKAQAARTMAEARSILRSSGMGTLRNAAVRNVSAEVRIGGRTVIYEPGMKESGMTLFGENGFVLGRNAFSSSGELTKTVLHELYRLTTSARGGASAASVANETAAAWRFADRAYNVGNTIGLW